MVGFTPPLTLRFRSMKIVEARSESVCVASPCCYFYPPRKLAEHFRVAATKRSPSRFKNFRYHILQAFMPDNVPSDEAKQT